MNKDMDRTSILFSMLVIMSIVITMAALSGAFNHKPAHLSWQCQQNNIGCPEGYVSNIDKDPQAP